MPNLIKDGLLLKGGYYYSSTVSNNANNSDESTEDYKPAVDFNLLIQFGEKPTVQILPDTYTAKHVKERMEGAEHIYIRVRYDDDELYNLGTVKP